MEKVETLGDILRAAWKKDEEQYKEFALTCPTHFGRICTNMENKGILCKYEACPHRTMQSGR
jgi:hypothetical protein